MILYTPITQGSLCEMREKETGSRSVYVPDARCYMTGEKLDHQGRWSRMGCVPPRSVVTKIYPNFPFVRGMYSVTVKNPPSSP